MNKKLTLEIFVILILASGYTLIFSYYVPYNMDEFYQYHIIAERFYPNNVLNVFAERPSSYDLAPFGDFFLPLRSFHYSGSISGLLYYPFFLVWRHPISARFFAALFLIFQSVLLYKIFNVRPIAAFLALLAFMPYAFQHTADTGPIVFQTTSIILIFYLLKTWLEKEGRHDKNTLWIHLLIAAAIFIAVWVKLSYFFLLVPISLMILYFAHQVFILDKSKLKRIISQLTVLVFSASLPIFLLISSSDRLGFPYAIQLLQTDLITPFTPDQGTRWSFIVSYLFNPLMAAHRIFEIRPSISILGILLLLSVLSFIIIGLKNIKGKKNFIILNLALFTITLTMTILHPKTWAMHHIVLCFPFLILALFGIGVRTFSVKSVKIAVFIFIALNLAAYIGLTKLRPQESDHPSKIKLNEVINRHFKDNYVIVITDWGFYYIKELYGDKSQCVINLTPLNKAKQIDLLKVILEKYSKKAVFLGRIDSESDYMLIRKAFPDLKEFKTNFDTGKWRVWYEG